MSAVTHFLPDEEAWPMPNPLLIIVLLSLPICFQDVFKPIFRWLMNDFFFNDCDDECRKGRIQMLVDGPSDPQMSWGSVPTGLLAIAFFTMRDPTLRKAFFSLLRSCFTARNGPNSDQGNAKTGDDDDAGRSSQEVQSSKRSIRDGPDICEHTAFSNPASFRHRKVL